ncbi:hypothetical protein ACTHGU_04660 [Chitinophagaceae bacterium MMS25-I14]
MELHQITGAEPTLAMTLDNTNAAKNSFNQRYFLAGGNPNFVKEFTVSWTDFASAVQQILDSTLFPEALLMLQFIHRFDASTNTWFLTMGGARRSQDSIGIVSNNKLYSVMPSDMRFDLKQGQVTQSAFTGIYDDMYFKSLYYKYDTGALTQLSTDTSHVKFVSVFTMPWQAEILKVFTDNQVDPDTSNVQLKFSCISPDYHQPSALSNVEFPHVGALYLNVNGVDYLDNNTYSDLQFKRKAADMASTNPPYNCQYVWPSALIGVGDCDDDHGNGHGHGHGHHDHNGTHITISVNED